MSSSKAKPSKARSAAQRSRRGSSRGLTLIELLVVLGIIAIIATFLVPSGFRMIENGRRIQCVSNLSTLGNAFHSYMADNNIFPQKEKNQPQDWLYLLKPYLASGSKATLCPTQIISGGKPKVFRSTQDTNLVTNYGINYWLTEGLATGGTGVVASRLPRLGNISSPANVGVLVDATSNWLKDVQPDRVRYAHDGKANILFLDGHVESLTKTAMETNGRVPYMGNPNN